MKAVILAGGLGSRLAEETTVRPKPMVEIGGRPILWHIMKMYSHHGINDFILSVGYKGYMIKEFFANYFLHTSDITFDIAHDKMEVHSNKSEPWRVTIVHTGDSTMTGGRIKRIADFIHDDTFCMTYGDGVSDINISQLLEFHKQHGKKATVSAVRPPGRFGALRLDKTRVTGFEEKPVGDGGLINGGFFVLAKSCIDLIAEDQTIWEQYPMRKLASSGELEAFRHDGFWQPMDTIRDKAYLESLWESGKAPWKKWS